MGLTLKDVFLNHMSLSRAYPYKVVLRKYYRVVIVRKCENTITTFINAYAF